MSDDSSQFARDAHRSFATVARAIPVVTVFMEDDVDLARRQAVVDMQCEGGNERRLIGGLAMFASLAVIEIAERDGISPDAALQRLASGIAYVSDGLRAHLDED